jgi:hypothetical protein
MDGKFAAFRLICLCAQLAGGCASIEQPPTPEVTYARVEPYPTPTEGGVSHALARGGVGMAKGAVMGATYFAIAPPFGPFWMIVTVPAGAAAGLVGGVASPSMDAVWQWPLMPSQQWSADAAAAWPKHDHETKRVIVHRTQPKPARWGSGQKSSHTGRKKARK